MSMVKRVTARTAGFQRVKRAIILPGGQSKELALVSGNFYVKNNANTLFYGTLDIVVTSGLSLVNDQGGRVVYPIAGLAPGQTSSHFPSVLVQPTDLVGPITATAQLRDNAGALIQEITRQDLGENQGVSGPAATITRIIGEYRTPAQAGNFMGGLYLQIDGIVNIPSNNGYYIWYEIFRPEDLTDYLLRVHGPNSR